VALPPPPPTPKRPVFATYFGTRVEDEYQWLETWGDPEVQAWSTAQNTYARAFLDGLSIRSAVRTRVDAILSHEPPEYGALVAKGGLLFFAKNQPPKQQPLLVVLAASADPATERVIVDPNALDPSGKTTLDWFVPSLDGKKVAVSLSQGGTESGDVHVYDVATAKETGDVVPRVNSGTAGGSLAWTAGGAGFFYTRLPHEGERAPEDLGFFQQIWFHTLGKPADTDSYAVGRDFPRIAEAKLSSSDDGRYVLARVENGDSDRYWVYLHDTRGALGAWLKIADPEDGVAYAAFGRDDAVYALSRKGAPRGRVLRLAPGTAGLAAATEVVPQGDTVIARITVTSSWLFLAEVEGGPSRFEAVPLRAGGGRQRTTIAIEPVSAVTEVSDAGGGDEVFFSSESYLTPPAWYRVTPGAAPQKTALAVPATVDFGDAEALRDTCTSKDGTPIPISIVRKKGTPLDGSSPTLLGGYGGFAIVRAPAYRPQMRVWLEQGGVWTYANLRGGGELGEDWHRDGALMNKQHVFDDFYACARLLVDRGYTTPARLGVEGGSNGGLLMGAFLTQHPDAAKAVVSHVGYYDMLRFETAPNGVFNTTEYGSVKDARQFAVLYAYSPYHRVQDGVAYPAVLFMTGANDPRVAPFHSRKMTARLQAATSSGQPILLRTSGDTGHGMGTPLSARIDELADAYSFLFDRLALAYHPSP
jgi:prolyl oligopeptidase